MAQDRGLDVEAAQQPEREPVGGVVEQRGEQVFGGGFGVLALLRKACSPREGSARAFGKSSDMIYLIHTQ